MSFEAWYTFAVIIGMFGFLIKEIFPPDITLFGALILLWFAGVIDSEEALHGFSNPQVITIGMLFVISAAMRETGALSWVTKRMLQEVNSPNQAMARLLVPTTALSAFMNNTPIVAMLTPIIRDWAKRNKKSPSNYLIPLSFAAILGGTCTLIGTSTNLVVSGLLVENGYAPFGMFELAAVGIPVSIVGLLYLIFIAPKLLPKRVAPDQLNNEEVRKYRVTLEVKPHCPLVDLSVEKAGLRHLSGLFLVEIERGVRRILPVRPTDRIQSGDRLVFYGLTETVVEITKTPGLRPIQSNHIKADKRLFEVVISPGSPLIGENLRQAGFRRRYDAAVVAIHRNGERIQQKLGDIVLRAGDTLLLEAARGFRASWANARDFYLVAEVHDSAKPKYHLAWIAILSLFAMVISVSIFHVDIVLASAVTTLFLILSGSIRPQKARYALNFSVILLIASAFGISSAVESSGLGTILADKIAFLGHALPPWILLALFYLLTSLFTELLSNAAAAALIFPIALSLAEQLNRDARPFAVVVAIAASLSFITPLGRPTNIIVYGPGGYRFIDFPKVGVPLFLICFAIAMIIIPFVW